MRNLLSLALFFTSAIAVSSLLAKDVAQPEFSADVLVTRGGRPIIEGRIFRNKIAERSELKAFGVPGTVIKRRDKNVWWTLLDADRYKEGPTPEDLDLEMSRTLPDGWTKKCSKGPVIDKHPTEQCVVNGSYGGAPWSATMWTANDLNGVLLRYQSSDGMEKTIKNVVVGPQAASLFEIPAGYRKLD